MVLCKNPASSFEKSVFAAEEKTATEIQTWTCFYYYKEGADNRLSYHKMSTISLDLLLFHLEKLSRALEQHCQEMHHWREAVLRELKVK